MKQTDKGIDYKTYISQSGRSQNRLETDRHRAAPNAELSYAKLILEFSSLQDEGFKNSNGKTKGLIIRPISLKEVGPKKT